MEKIVPHLWYSERAVEAAEFYVSLFRDSRVDSVTVLPGASPSDPDGSVEMVEFTLLGQSFRAIAAGPLDPFNHAVSFMVMCEDQAEIDHYWDGLLEGGEAEMCGWLRDRYGMSWQIVPTVLGELINNPDPDKAKRAREALLGMVKIDIADLRAASEGVTV